MKDNVAISISNISKTFKLPHEKNNSIKSAILNFYQRKKTYETQQVLKNISFDINKGDFFGIVGRNGSGKSTLLKIIAGIYTPTEGSVQVAGKLTPFIELGVGFNPELTGRENVFLNGALLGFSRKEMKSMYVDIVEFAELEKFMDQKLKNYSSGMQVRLAFSIAIRADTDILVLDEVLAVGDERFQDKCINIFEKFKRSGKTVVLVTHDMNSVRRFCNKAVVIHDSKLVYEGLAPEATIEYVKLNFPETVQAAIEKDLDGIAIKQSNIMTKVSSINDTVNNETLFMNGDRVSFEVSWKKNRLIKNLGVAIYTESGQYVYGTNTIIDKIKITGNKMVYNVEINLGSGKYSAQVGLFGASDSEKIYYDDKAITFRVVNDQQWQGLTKLNHKWLESN